MKLQLHQLDLTWAVEEVPVENLRSWIINQINEIGEPVRWAITSMKHQESEPFIRQLIVEVVVIVA